MEAAAGINYKSPGDYVYAQSGVAVERTAIGAPTSIFTGAAFGNLSSQYGQSLVKLTHCVPVLTSNPARCQKSGRVTAVSANHLVTQVGNITLSHGVLPENLPSVDFGLSRVLGRDSAMSNDIFPLDTGSVGSVGATFMVFGARNDEQGDVSFASYLAGTVNDPDDSAGRGGNATYAVTCAVDASSSFEYRRVTLDLRALGKDKGSNYAQYLSGGEPCVPSVPTIGSKLLATAGSASITLVHENLAKDGYFATLHRLSGYRRGPPYAFPESTNALEDVLGLISGLAVSRLPLADEVISAAEVNEGKYRDSSSAVIEMTRLGTGSSEALWLLIPPAGSLIALFILFVMGIRRQWVRGGRCFSGSERERPHLYTAESAYYLIRLGTTAVRNVDQKSAIQ
ncbi:hypothetical protein NUW58_g2118 [Xylaria curta]|uniref:Uncharacterized protein n=1 Tax=Xylaria curta TaxID=42375 RepID=A0ACC1PHM3_9PEZI|nr:hypothetical protein NUW58_g2118 [Xylaria curta]